MAELQSMQDYIYKRNYLDRLAMQELPGMRMKPCPRHLKDWDTVLLALAVRAADIEQKSVQEIARDYFKLQPHHIQWFVSAVLEWREIYGFQEN